ncbi:MAG: HD-GYP domain-containing protein [Treponema sp.]|jgi:HD-GYP domain-containing protein (c-di-GMP phosphodiesterase class II)|nr:HD-GYP domain-containing protein [Treponema sp.]
MKEYAIKEIPLNSFFTRTLYLDKSFVLSSPEMPFTRNMAKFLDKWKYASVFSEGEPNKEYINIKTEAELAEGGIKNISNQSDSDKLEKAEKQYTEFLRFVDSLFVRATVSEELEFNEVSDKMREMVEYIREDRRFLMRVIKNFEPAPERSYLATHSVRSTILAIIIGTYIKLPNHRLIELGIAALLHEIGMFKLPLSYYLSQRPLTSQEQKAIFTHPVLGYSMLKSFNFPLPICLAALEHHERENGTGYPRHIGGEKISLYSKIIAVTCSYEALNSKRPHREAKDGYTGMVELLKNEGKQYDDTIVRALVLSLSIYPIGLYVLLSNGKKGQVVDVNPENPRFPIVQIFGEFTPDGKIKTAQTEPGELTIERPLNRSEIEN